MTQHGEQTETSADPREQAANARELAHHGRTTETTAPDALPSWIDDAAAVKWVAERTCVNPERDWDIDDVGEAFRAGQAHADAGLLAALEDIERQAYAMISGIDRYNEKHGEFIGGGLVFQLARSVGVARAAIAAAKGAGQ
jgi:hypothetical protein